MAANIKSVFIEEAQDVKIDNKLIKRIDEFERNFVNKNDDHIAFFGSNLLGVNPVRFRQEDRNMWFDDVVDIDDFALREKLHSLDTINTNWHVQSDVFNHTCTWLVHAIYNSSLSSKKKEQGMLSTLLVLQYKFISSLMAHNFKYPADREIALATYAALSRKFSLKQHGNWYALLLARAQDIIDKDSIHIETIANYDDDEAINRMIADIQGRLKEIVKKMVTVFYRVRKEDTKMISRSSSGVDLDGYSVVNDQMRNHTQYKRYIQQVFGDKRNLIKEDLLKIIGDAMHTMPKKLLVETLEYCADNYQVRGEKDIDELLEETLLHAFDYLGREDNWTRNTDLAGLIKKLRAIYMSSRSSDPSLMKMRELGENIVKKAVRTKNNSTVASVRTGLLLYIVLRTLTMNHYSQ